MFAWLVRHEKLLAAVTLALLAALFFQTKCARRAPAPDGAAGQSDDAAASAPRPGDKVSEVFDELSRAFPVGRVPRLRVDLQDGVRQRRSQRLLLGPREDRILATPQGERRHPNAAQRGRIFGFEQSFEGRAPHARRHLQALHHHASRSSYGACLTKLGRFREAEEHLRTGYEGLKAAYDDRHERTQKAAAHLVELYRAWGRPDEAARHHALLLSKANK